jgi:DNA-binding IclR family transcriptional regulator
VRHDTSNGGTPKIAAIGKTLALLEAILADREGQSVAAIAARIDLPRATAHRQVVTLLDQAYLRKLKSGQLVAGPRLSALARGIDGYHELVATAAPVLRKLSAKLGCISQLGTLENEMVTYRYKTGAHAGALFTLVSGQLEAYCTGLGKVLLAHLPERQREAYLASGPFPPLTPNTITQPDELRVELANVRSKGFAMDREEIAIGLVCYAAPVRLGSSSDVAAISVSSNRYIDNEGAILSSVLEAAARIEELMHANE